MNLHEESRINLLRHLLGRAAEGKSDEWVARESKPYQGKSKPELLMEIMRSRQHVEPEAREASELDPSYMMACAELLAAKKAIAGLEERLKHVQTQKHASDAHVNRLNAVLQSERVGREEERAEMDRRIVELNDLWDAAERRADIAERDIKILREIHRGPDIGDIDLGDL